MIIKFLAFIAVLAMIYFIFFKKPKVTAKNSKKSHEDESVMVECSKCGVFVSNKEAIIKSGSFYCSNECAGL